MSFDRSDHVFAYLLAAMFFGLAIGGAIGFAATIARDRSGK